MYDLLITKGLVVTPTGEMEVDILVKDGLISAMGQDLSGFEAKETIDASGLVVTPGMIDTHMHITDPGGGVRDGWEGYLTGTKAAAKGGITSFIEMPLNQLPCTADREALKIKLDVSKGQLSVDVYSLGALTPYNLDSLADLAQDGVVGFKAFLATCGDPSLDQDMQNVDDYSLWEGMRRIEETGLPLMVHCENAPITDKLGQLAKENGPDTLATYVASRPVFTEVESVRRAIFFAEETGCRLVIAHCSCPEAIHEVVEAQKRGVDVVAESCPHYFYFTTDELDEVGNTAKCSPPIRDQANQDALWEELFAGNIAFIGSDHSPATEDLKDTSPLKAWGGIAGSQNAYDIFFDEAVNKRGMDLGHFVDVTATNAAIYFGLEGKGAIQVGFDADFVLIDPNKSYTVTPEGLEYKNKLTAYMGREIGCKVVKTIVRGHVVYDEQTGVSEDFIGESFLMK